MSGRILDHPHPSRSPDKGCVFQKWESRKRCKGERLPGLVIGFFVPGLVLTQLLLAHATILELRAVQVFAIELELSEPRYARRHLDD